MRLTFRSQKSKSLDLRTSALNHDQQNTTTHHRTKDHTPPTRLAERRQWSGCVDGGHVRLIRLLCVLCVLDWMRSGPDYRVCPRPRKSWFTAHGTRRALDWRSTNHLGYILGLVIPSPAMYIHEVHRPLHQAHVSIHRTGGRARRFSLCEIIVNDRYTMEQKVGRPGVNNPN